MAFSSTVWVSCETFLVLVLTIFFFAVPDATQERVWTALTFEGEPPEGHMPLAGDDLEAASTDKTSTSIQGLEPDVGEASTGAPPPPKPRVFFIDNLRR